MAGLKRVGNVLDYLINLNKNQPIEKMSRTEKEQLLKALGWKKEKDYEQACHKLLRLVNYFKLSESKNY